MEEKVLIKGKKGSPIFSLLFCMLLVSVPVLAYYSVYSDRFMSARNKSTLLFFFGVLIVIAVLTSFTLFILSLITKVTVTNKKVFGITSKYTKAVIPVETIESINLTTNDFSFVVKSLKGECVYKFNGYKNAVEIVETVNQLIPKKQETDESDFETLKKYKELLDNNIITQQEFDEKKKELLGL